MKLNPVRHAIDTYLSCMDKALGDDRKAKIMILTSLKFLLERAVQALTNEIDENLYKIDYPDKDYPINNFKWNR